MDRCTVGGECDLRKVCLCVQARLASGSQSEKSRGGILVSPACICLTTLPPSGALSLRSSRSCSSSDRNCAVRGSGTGRGGGIGECPSADSKSVEMGGTPRWSVRRGDRRPLKPTDGGGERLMRGGSREGSRGRRTRGRLLWRP